MERKVFENCNFLVTFYYYYDNEFDCFGCKNKQEVFQVLTDKIKDELKFIRDEQPEFLEEISEDADDAALIQYVDSHECIANPAIIESVINLLCPDGGGITYRVSNDNGTTWFSYGLADGKL